MDVPAQFVMAALREGWTVSMNKDGELEFTKNRHRMTREERRAAAQHGYSQKFLQSITNRVTHDNCGKSTKLAN